MKFFRQDKIHIFVTFFWIFVCTSVNGVAEPASFSGSKQLRLAGSSTVFPFSAIVAELFTKQHQYPAPVVESNGTGGGIHQFCTRTGDGYPDIVNASRQIKESERHYCAQNGISDIHEIVIGYDGIIIANKKGEKLFDLSPQDLWLALAKEIPYQGKLIPNPNTSWKDIQSTFPKHDIEILGPPPTSGTRESFTETIMQKGCPDLTKILNMSEQDAKFQCSLIREDGAFVDAGENDNLIIQKLQKNKYALGVVGYSYYARNTHLIQASKISGTEATPENVRNHRYTAARSLFIYTKPPVPLKKEALYTFIDFYLSQDMLGENGFLAQKGLIPLTETERQAQDVKIKQELKKERRPE